MLGIPSLDPYSALIKIATKLGLVALVVLIIVGGYYKIQTLEAQLGQAELKLAVSERSMKAFIKNTTNVSTLEARHRVEFSKLQRIIDIQRGVLKNVPTHPVPENCKAVVADFYAPYAAAFKFLREQQADRNRKIAAATARLSLRPGSTEFGELRNPYAERQISSSSILGGSLEGDGLPW